MITEVVTADIGGTHARFAIATRDARGITLSHIAKLKVRDHASLQTAFEAYAEGVGRPLPRQAGVAVATPVEGELLKMTNNPWVIRPAMIAERLGLDAVTLINDFAAVAHAIAVSGPADFAHVAGPLQPLPAEGVISIVGPGTGLGVGLLLNGNPYRVVPTEGGHLDFAPLDSLEDRLLLQLRQTFRRVSVERVVSGPGLTAIHGALSAIEGRAVAAQDDNSLWDSALNGRDTLAEAALDRWFLSLGAVVGDIALAQGAEAVVLAGGMTPRVAHLLPTSGFHPRFIAKGRFEARMAGLPIWRITHPEPGLLGAAAAHLKATA